MGAKSLIYFEVITTLALLIGLIVVNVIKPGIEYRSWMLRTTEITGRLQGIKETIINIFPDNFFDAAARGDVLEVVVFTILFAIALSLIKDRKKPIIEFCEALSETMFKYTSIVMYYAPIGVGAAIAAVVGSKGLSVLLNLGLLIVSLYVGIMASCVWFFFQQP